MKTPVIIAISAGVSIVAVIGALIGIGAYQQYQQQEQVKKEAQFLLDLFDKVAEEQKQSHSIQEKTPQSESTTQDAKSALPLPPKDCSGHATCLQGYVTEIIDGDTIKVNGQSIRFALVDAPEINVPQGNQARSFIEEICPLGSPILIDEDDGQTKGSFGRMIAVIYCNGTNLNKAILDKGLADIDEEFCEVSEFSYQTWIKNHGCETKEIQPSTSSSQTNEGNCDPSYPDFCIAPPPPDLNCKDVLPHKKFTVKPPDPHKFDGNKDGIGCE